MLGQQKPSLIGTGTFISLSLSLSLSLYIYIYTCREEERKNQNQQCISATYPSPSNLHKQPKKGFGTNVQLNNHFIFIYNDKQTSTYQWYPATGANFVLGPTLTNSPFMHS
jgi:hypothetical protein